MAKTQTKTEVVVSYHVMDYHYRTHKPQGLVKAGPFRTAKKAASEFAYHVASDFAHRYPKKYKRPRRKPNTIAIEMIWDSPFWNTRYEKAYRRAFKIFKALGMK